MLLKKAIQVLVGCIIAQALELRDSNVREIVQVAPPRAERESFGLTLFGRCESFARNWLILANPVQFDCRGASRAGTASAKGNLDAIYLAIIRIVDSAGIKAKCGLRVSFDAH